MITSTLALALAAAGAPSPLYGAYASRWHFGAITVTAVFAVYALALLATLVICGSLSDSVGRRPVIVAGLGLLAVCLVLFLVVDGVPLLYCARIVQGVATALITAGVSAALIDLQPADRPGRGALVNAVTPAVGLAVGGIGSGALVQYGPVPLRLTYAVLLGCTILLIALVLRVREPVRTRRPLDLRMRIGVEPSARSAFLRVSPCLIAVWALGGLYLSLGPSLLLAIAGSSNRLLGGSIVFALCAPGAVASLVAARWSPTRTLRTGSCQLVGGLIITIIAVQSGSAFMLIGGTVVAGAGFGAGFLGALRTVIALATPARRGELVAAVYLVAYLAFSLPAVIAGVLATHVGLRHTTIGYAVAVAALALAAALADGRRAR